MEESSYISKRAGNVALAFKVFCKEDVAWSHDVPFALTCFELKDA